MTQQTPGGEKKKNSTLTPGRRISLLLFPILSDQRRYGDVLSRERDWVGEEVKVLRFFFYSQPRKTCAAPLTARSARPACQQDVIREPAD